MGKAVGTMTSSTPRVAFVVPWYGSAVSGGAETACRNLAVRLRRTGLQVEVLTTCAKDLLSGWAHNYHGPGSWKLDGVVVRRFPLRASDITSFHELNRKLLNGQLLSEEEEVKFITESVNSEELCQFIADRTREYCFFFTPYLFGTTYWGAKISPDRSFLIPCLHDESYARLRIFDSTFREVRGVLCYSKPEMELAKRLYSLPDSRLYLLGTGVEPATPGDGSAFRRKYRIRDEFVLYLGRRDAGKGVPTLVNYFCGYKERTSNRLRLVLAGSGAVDLPATARGDIIDLGFLSEEDKRGACAAATVLCQPSRRESFSLVMMEAWVQGTPVLVNADCAVTTYHCLKSNGGLFFRGYGEFAGCLNFFLQNPAAAQRMGQLGRRYVKSYCSWSDVVERFLEVLHRTQEES
jgi:glycosyltransferase involved in cell wall biosynthesis